MKLSVICVLSLLLGACSATPSPVVPPQEVVADPTPAPVAAPTPAPSKATVISRKAFTATVPVDFNFREGYPKSDGPVTNEFFAMSQDYVMDYPIVVTLSSWALDDEDPTAEDFGAAVAMMTIESKGDNVIQAKPITIDGLPGSIVAYTEEDGQVGIIQIAAARNRNGVLARCGGARGEQQVVDVCKAFFASIKIKG